MFIQQSGRLNEGVSAGRGWRLEGQLEGNELGFFHTSPERSVGDLMRAEL